MAAAEAAASTGPDVASVIATYLDHLTVERGLAANTLASYRRDLRRYRDVLAERGRDVFERIDEADVLAFLTGLRAGDGAHAPLSSGSVARAVVAVRGLHRFAARQGFASADVAREVHPPAPPRRLPRAITVAQVESLLDATGPPDVPLSVRGRALLELLYGCGARISEAVGLDVDDVDLDAEVVRLAGKGGKERIVPVGRYACRAVGGYLVRARPVLAGAAGSGSGRRAGTPALFLNARGGRLTRQGAWGVLHAAARRAGLDEVTPHTLRHSFATHLLDGGADVRVVQELLGHASVTTTQVYTLVTVDKLREVYAAAHPRWSVAHQTPG